MKKLARGLLAAAAFSTLTLGASSAWSATTNLVDWSTQLSGNQAHIFGAGFGAYTPGTWDSDPTVTGNASGFYQSPWNNTGSSLNTTRSYFSVGASTNGNGALSPATLTFSGPIDYLNLLWGSLDSYNAIEFYVGDALSYTLTGSFVHSLIVAACESVGACNGQNATNFEQVARLNITDLGGVTSAKFYSYGQNASEFATIPLPAALPLFGAALGGLLLLRSKRNRAAALAA